MNRSDSLANKMLLAAVLAAGTVVVNMLGWGIASTILDSVFSGEQVSEYLEVHVTGEVIRNTNSSNGRYSERRSLAGEPIEVQERDHQRLIAQGLGVSPPPRQTPIQSWLPSLSPSEPTVWDDTYWYVRQPAPGSRLFFLEAYSVKTYLSTGCLSRAGFSSTRPLERDMWEVVRDVPRYWSGGHGGRLAGREFFAAKDGVWRIDLPDLKTELILPEVVSDSVGQIVLNPVWPSTAEKPRVGIVVRHDHAIQVFDLETSKPRELPLKPEYRESYATLYALTEDRLLLMVAGDKVNTTDLQWIAPDGTITREEHVTLLRQKSWFNDPPAEAGGVMVAAVFPCPALMGAALAIESLVKWVRGGVSYQPSAKDRRTTFVASLTLALISGVSAWLCSRHAKRYHVRHRTAWVLFTLAFGAAGLVGYWCHRRWPVLAVSEWVKTGTTTAPALKGTEVFA